MATAPKMDKGADLPPSYFESVSMMNSAGSAPPPPGFVGGLPPQHQMGMGMGMPNATPVVVTTVVPLGNRPINMVCPHCRAEIRTATEKRPGLIAFISGAVLAMLGCVWGCCKCLLNN
ncbi:Lipopolysaccharide-induced tumor necrosis factor-alpha factor [Orchesella cincta]|uniref:Lipopolysaccharide-induced tumor necrosis factor-alpha factor n=1 Tax=Orchesella cincta TaxID=48709 RepID=A0A1D2M4S2_ORCCI|nr:Lipopolysaccharide-induced tumor necrosis factor-alpha factor [Orchesella cincta]